MSSEEEGGVGQNMELFDGSALRGQLELVNGVLFLPVDILEVGLVEVKGFDGLIRHETVSFGDVLIDIEEEEFVLSKHHNVVTNLLNRNDVAISVDTLHQTPIFLHYKHKLR